MKKTMILLSLCLCLLLAGCNAQISDGAAKQAAEISGQQSGFQAAEPVPYVLDQTEYVLYQNIFFNGQAGEYVGKTFDKTGILIRLEDRWSQVTRYYVWGYMDATKCCDWQWEFVPKDPDSLPANGSLVKMTGTLRYDEKALDKYWFTDAEIEVKTVYGGDTAEVDMCTMSATLERVQLVNMQVYPDDFAGKRVRMYGRILQPAVLQHPYYDNAWTQEFETGLPVPAIGTVVIVSGTWKDGTVKKAAVTATKDY